MSEAPAGTTIDTVELETINLSVSPEGAATIELNRPQALNAWNRQFGADLLDALRRVGEDQSIRAALITGAGRAFSAGADLKDFGSANETPEGRPDIYTMLTERYHPIITAVRQMPKPVVAAVNGPAAGIGCSLALCCDLIIAAESAYLMLAFVNIGLVADGGSSVLVPSRVGMARASEMAMLGERIEARKALEWGLINRVVADEHLHAEADALLRRLAAGPTRSYAGTKRELNNWLYSQMAQQLELEANIQGELAGSDDFLEGVSAFVQKRAARFKGA
jgi:2-(1,2-epoxy-1,2-dihydrophenyl)acetyl-CoA isomerase